MARLVALAACLGLTAGQATVYIDVSGGGFTYPYYTFSPSVPTSFVAGTPYVFTANGIGTIHPFRVGTSAGGFTPSWVTGTTAGLTGTGGTIQMTIPGAAQSGNIVLYCNTHPNDMALTVPIVAASLADPPPPPPSTPPDACPSDVLEEYWLAGAPEQSCTAACAAEGRTCVADAAMPTTSDCFEHLSNLPRINIACDDHYHQAYETVTPHFLTQLGATGCYHVTPSAAATFTLNCDYDTAGYPAFRRLCPCTHYPPSVPPPTSPPPSLPPPPPPPIAPLTCPVSEATCTDHGANEAAATAECAGNPLCYVLGPPHGPPPTRGILP